MSYLLDTDMFIYWMKDNPAVVSRVLGAGPNDLVFFWKGPRALIPGFEGNVFPMLTPRCPLAKT